MPEFEQTYTNREESKKLLELGLPIDTSDCYYYEDGFDAVPIFWTVRAGYRNWDDKTPCWTVGRLIQIYSKVTHLMSPNLSNLGTLNDMICEISKQKKSGVDFSNQENYEKRF